MRRFLAIVILIALFPSPVLFTREGSLQDAPVQQDSVRLGYSVEGKVVDARSRKPMASVHVSLPGRHHATVTNADGRFILKSDSPIGEVEFSFVGYRTHRLTAPKGVFLKVSMTREDAVLDEASIIYGNPMEIIRSAVDKIRDTYCTEPQLLECFYRETLQKRGRYTYVAEAVARLYKSRFDGFINRDAAAIEKSRVLVSQKRRDTLSVKTQGGPTLALSYDVVKNPDIIFNDTDIPLYIYEMKKPEYIGDRLQFVISFKPGALVDYPLFYGTAFIDRELLTFTRVELSMDMRNKSMVTRTLLVKKPFSLRFSPEEVSYVVSYSLRDGKTTLEYLRGTMKFSCDWKKRLFKTKYTAVNELVVTDVRDEAVPIDRKDRFKTRDILGDKASEFLDPAFWEGYNIIAPSESLEHAIDKLKKQ